MKNDLRLLVHHKDAYLATSCYFWPPDGLTAQQMQTGAATKATTTAATTAAATATILSISHGSLLG